MKNHFYIALLLYTLLSCSTKTGEKSDHVNHKHSFHQDSMPISAHQNNFSDYVKSIEGTWVNKAYLETIIKTKSPYLTQEKSPYYMIYVKSDMIKNKLIGIYDYQYGQTEISNIPYYSFTNGSLVFEYDTFDGEILDKKQAHYFKSINLIVTKKDTTLRVKTSKNKIIELKRIDNNCIDATFDCEITQLISSKILQGNYKLLDSSKMLVAKNLILDQFGRMKGHAKFKRAILWNNFREVNHAFEFDVLEFIPQTAKMDDYGFYRENTDYLFKFEYKKDTIKLKRIRYKDEIVSVGNICYYLIRK